MISIHPVKFLVTSCLFVVVAFGAAAAHAGAGEFVCAGRDEQQSLPLILRIKIVSSDVIEVDATDKSNRDSAKVTVRRLEVANQSNRAIFLVGGSLGVSGDARLLVSKDALRLEELGTVMLVNQSTHESAIYPCSKRYKGYQLLF
ncbi:hypothetical protein BH10BDE1_BH10BDE1_17440 [soil metagenome]